VELKAEDKRDDLWLAHDPTRWPCPECDAEMAAGWIYTHANSEWLFIFMAIAEAAMVQPARPETVRHSTSQWPDGPSTARPA